MLLALSGGYKYNATGSISLEIDYDTNGDIRRFYFEAIEITSYQDGSGLCSKNQVINFTPYEGEVTAPDWLNDYEAGGTTDSD